MESETMPSAPDSANNALDTLGDLVFSQDILSNDMDIAGNHPKTPSWPTATPNSKFGVNVDGLAFLDSPSVNPTTDDLKMSIPPASQQNVVQNNKDSRIGAQKEQQNGDQNSTEETKKLSPDLGASAAGTENGNRYRQKVQDDKDQLAAEISNIEQHRRMIMTNNGNSHHMEHYMQQQQQQQQQMLSHQQQQSNGSNVLPVPSAWKFHEATGPGGLSNISHGVASNVGDATGNHVRPPLNVGHDIGTAPVHPFAQNHGTTAHAPGYHGPWAASSQVDGLGNDSASHMHQQQWHNQQYWQMVTQQNPAHMAMHSTNMDTTNSMSNMPTGRGGGKGGGKELSDKRRQDRNDREQKRSKRISDQIKELKQLLEVSGVRTNKGNKSSVLTCAADYIADLQRRNHMLSQGEGVNGHGTVVGGQIKKVSEGEGEGGDKDSIEDSDSAHGIRKNHVDYQRVFYDQSVPMAITSVDGRFVDCNWRFERDSGYKKEDLTRMTFFSIARSESDVSIFQAVAEMLKDSREDGSKQFIVRAVLKPPKNGEPDQPQRYLTLSTVYDHSGPKSEVKYFSCALLQSPIDS